MLVLLALTSRDRADRAPAAPWRGAGGGVHGAAWLPWYSRCV